MCHSDEIEDYDEVED